MKSIKEKSNEYAEEQDLRMAYNGSCDDCQQGFVVGANYVLEQLEEFLNLYGIYCINSSAKAYLKDMIEQLKK